MTKFPFEVSFSEIEADPDPFVTAVFSCLESEFLVVPKGPGFVEYPVFERGYETLKQATVAFEDILPEKVLTIVYQLPISLIVIRTILGFTPPEWAYITTQRSGVEVTQGFIRSLDRKIRIEPYVRLKRTPGSVRKIEALITTACALLQEGAPSIDNDKLYRLDKADTSSGRDSLRAVADLGVPYAMLLYERFLGRPFAGHRDSVSELIGNVVENAVEDVLHNAGVTFHKTKRAERLPRFDQTPDFVIPSIFNPQVVIEAKLTEDDGTARDKVTRIQHLEELSRQQQPSGDPKFQVVACIAGRGFGVRREDMKKLIVSTRGKVFTLKNMNQLVDHTKLREFRSR